jgi:hypothetical protein
MKVHLSRISPCLDTGVKFSANLVNCHPAAIDTFSPAQLLKPSEDLQNVNSYFCVRLLSTFDLYKKFTGGSRGVGVSDPLLENLTKMG